MLRFFAIILVICTSSLLFGWISFPNPSPKSFTTTSGYFDSTRAASNYRNYCGGCHGEKMDAFVDRQWKHGTTREDLYRSMKIGYLDEGMPAFDSAFTDEEMYELSDYMLKGIENFKRYDYKPVIKENLFAATDISVRLDTVVSGLRSIWGMAFMPDGGMIITDKSGKLYHVANNRKKTEIEGVPEVMSDNQGGLMDVALHPQFSKNKWVYISYSAVKEIDGRKLSTTAVMRGTLKGHELTDKKIVFEASPYASTKHHFGSRMVFGRDGFLYITVGERGNEKENPQSLANDHGKVHRIKDDGGIPADNPFIHTPGARPTIYSYGHRNPQGLTLHPVTGEIWLNEHGPRGGDEINVVKKGANYGWPVITYGINYNGKIISNKTEQEGMEQPVVYWIPSIGPSGMTFVKGKRYKGWEGNVVSGSLRFNYLNLTRVKGHQVAGEEMLLKNVGRLRDVRMGPDNYLYIAVENPGYIFRLVPVKK